jgi:group I intron endonuclease
MYYTIYKTTNLKNNKFYIGKHQTKNLNDDYLGSGIKLKEAIKKYGKNSFSKEILFIFFTEEEMNNKEKELINEDLVKNPNTYNIGIGGEGGPHFLNKSHKQETKTKISNSSKGKKISSESKEKMSKNNFMRGNSEQARKNASHRLINNSISEEIKQKISLSLINKKQNTIECPHCKKIGGERAMKRWHFSNCKFYSDLI